MAKKKSVSSVRAGRTAKKSQHILDDEGIDYSDIPPTTDEQLAKMRRVGRPTHGPEPKELIAIRLEPQLIFDLRGLAEEREIGYQTLIGEILSEYIRTRRTR